MGSTREKDKIINEDLKNVIKESFDSKNRGSVKTVMTDHLINMKPEYHQYTSVLSNKQNRKSNSFNKQAALR